MATSGYLDLNGRYAQSGVPIVQNTVTTNTGSQRWHVLPTDSGYVKLQSRLSGKAAAVSGALIDPGTPLVSADFGDALNDQWRLAPPGSAGHHVGKLS
ncbi:RICIN domain-containing protein [Actinopolymorpha alba]|uniref:RICIN domain-containing protein n=1 Tax=Actinopolymorpha alba TaxID=533267 RepID=UPI0003619EE0|nr:RICIN domain-containing protein [Actinopolymorpha alba]